MTNFKEWEYKKMGFNSQDELDASIKRVTWRMENPKNDIEIGASNKVKFENDLQNNNDRIDFSNLKEGARLSDLDIEVYNRIVYERNQAKLQEEQKEMQSVLKAAADNIQEEKVAAAQSEIEKRSDSLKDELQTEIYSKHGIKTDKEKNLDDSYSHLLKGLN